MSEKKSSRFKTISANIEHHQHEFMKKKNDEDASFNTSRFLRTKIDELMKREKNALRKKTN